jgi:hypothetical protein
MFIKFKLFMSKADLYILKNEKSNVGHSAYDDQNYSYETKKN